MNIRKIHIVLVLGTIMVFLLTSCSTKKNKWNRRVFHNLTGHYNAYYNGNVSLNEAIDELAISHFDDYTQVLDVFPLGSKENATNQAAKLDRSIMKGSIVIHKHSMYFRKKEHVKWVYYSYLMMGKARFYKQEYGTSKQIFKYITTRYPKENVKQDAMMWIALIESIQGNYQESISQLDAIKSKVSSGQVSKESYRMLPMVYADVYLRQKNYDASIPYLKLAINRANIKETKARLFFILAQVEQEQALLKKAVDHYLQVLKKNPTYEMDFNARMNMAKCYDGGDSRVVIKQLNKMLKDIKNEEFKDQIYYVLAEVSLKDKKKPQAINYLKLSVQTSVNNNKQKAFSALKLAEIYFEDQKYPNSQAYYDSTMLFLPKDYPDYDKLSARKDILTDLVKNLIVIQHEDSLQELANMSERERLEVIDDIILAEIETEKRLAEEERERKENLQFAEQNRREETQMASVTQKASSSWYFYNSRSVNSGYTEFVNKWGRRKLADNWRFSDQEVISFGDEDEGGEVEEGESEEGESEEGVASQNDDNTSLETNNKSRDFYLQDIPLTKEKLAVSDAKIESALFATGVIYKEKLLNNPKAVESFDELLRRFPKGENIDQVYYNMYRMYSNEGNRGDANYYKKKLIKEYPESEYAKILQDPDYFKKLVDEANKVKVLYKQTYELYLAKQYAQAQKNCAQAKTEYPDNEMQLARFEMLNALCVGSTKDTAAFIAALQKVVADYPDSEVKPIAENMIELLTFVPEAEVVVDEEGNVISGGEVKNTSIFVQNAEETHMFLVLADKRNVKISELKNRISDHNSKYYGTENLTVSAIPINENILLIGVSDFKNDTRAMDYFKSAKRNSLLYVMLKKNGGNFFIISEGNYSRLYKSKDLDGYRQFYSQMYPEGK